MQVVEGKTSCAGLAPEQTTEGGLSKKCKLSAKENAVASLPRVLNPSAKVTAASPRLDIIPLLQRKIQKLKKQSRPFEVYTAGSKNRLLPSDKRSMTDASAICYNSKGPVEMLNGKAKNRSDGITITCRHLAYAFATGGFGSKTDANQDDPKVPGGKFHAVASIENIQNIATIKTDQQLEKTPVRMGIPKVALYFDGEHIGQALYDVWVNKGVGDQAFHGKRPQTWFLGTENHSMAIRLVPTIESAIKIELYDPNYTTIVRRVMVSNEEILKQLTLNQFFPIPDQKCYAITQAGVLISTDAVESENDSEATVLVALTPSLLYLLMKHGQLNSSSMDSLKTILSEVRSDNRHEFILLLAAKSENGLPGLFAALANGHQEVVSTYLQGIKQFEDILEPGDLKKLLAAKSKTGTPGLFMALQNGHPEAISAYLEGIKQFGDIIEPGIIWELLVAKVKTGTPGLFMALGIGHQEAISAYFEAINQFRHIIGPEIVKELLVAKSENGLPGLFAALANGHQDAVSAYVQGIRQFEDILEPGDLEKVLAAKSERGSPGLFAALANGHQEAVSAYFHGVKQFGDIIEPEFIKELLAAKRGDGTSGLSMAQQNGHQEAISAYVQGINQFSDIIGPEVIKELLAS